MSNRSSTSKVKWFYGTTKWRECSHRYLMSVGGICERCYEEKGIINAADVVHHKIHLTPQNVNDPDVSLNWNNLQALCTQCHAEVHAKYKPQTRRYLIDETGHTITTPDGDDAVKP